MPEWFSDKLGEMSESLNEAKKEHVFVVWTKDDGVLRWNSITRSGSDLMKKKPTKKEVVKHMEKVFGKGIDVEYRED